MAANQILQMLSGQTNDNSPLGMLSNLRNSSNPQELLKSMPQYQQAINYISQNGGDPKTAFYNLAARRGINPNDILNQIR